jgi:tRNA threonylcarbamoyladenosine dehydratase
VVLLATCVERGLAVVSSMGASARVDPTLMRVGDLSETRVCPLARAVRKALSKQGVRTGITCIYSEEAPLPPLPPDEDDEVLRRGRVRNRLPSLSVMPGIFGYALAGEVIQRLAGVKPGEAR